MIFLNPKVMAAVEQLDYRVTAGDVAVQSGLSLQVAQQGLMLLASEAGGHLQVTETGEVAYLFGRQFRAALQAKYWRLRLRIMGQRVWAALFYLIRISFGIVLIASICLIAVAILVLIAASMARDSDSSDSGGGSSFGGGGFPIGWMFSDLYYFFSPNPYSGYSRRSSYLQYPAAAPRSETPNFLEAVFSFLFGEGDPNRMIDERRWQLIGQTLRSSQGSVVAEQIVPFLATLESNQTEDDAMLPVLLRFNGQPEVSPEGEIVYQFPELQTSVKSTQPASTAAFLQESFWNFSRASSAQVMAAIGLGGVNLIGALALGKLLSTSGVLGGFLGFVQAIYPLLLVYGIGFLVIPLGRHFWNQWQNQRIAVRNQRRERLAQRLKQPSKTLLEKLNFARQFGRSALVDDQQLVYTTEKDLLEQEAENQAAIDADWQKRLDRSTPHPPNS